MSRPSPSPAPPPPPTWWEQARDTPLSAAVLAACVVATGLVELGSPPVAEAALSVLYRNGPAIWQGAWWALIPSIFLHSGPMHLVFNGFWIWDLGRRLERDAGAGWLLAGTVAAAFVSSAAQLAVSGAQGIGYSGVVYAMAGAAWAAPPERLPTAHAFARQSFGLLLLWAVVCIGYEVTGTWNIGNGAHFGGLGFGLAVGWALRGPTLRWGLVAAVIVAAAGATAWAPWQPGWAALHAG